MIDRNAGTTRFLALSCVGFIASALPTTAMAQSAPAAGEEQAVELEGVTVTDSAIDEEIKVERLESPKATRALIDTPQTITVIGDQVIRKQNLLTLRDALATVPGITFGAGEGGGGYGDSINLRGYSANNDITQDGVRDSAQYSRTETFDLQQIEVYNGANTVFNGSGSVGGTINLVSKLPQAEDLTIVQAGIGTDNYYRATADANVRLSDLIAVRLNAVVHKNDVPGRDVEYYERAGIAPSIKIGVDGPTSLTFDYLHQRDNNVPVFGVPYYKTATNDGPLPGANDSDYFGISNLDDQEITVDRLTMRLDHALSDAVSIRNLTRWQRVKQNAVTSAPQGAYCLSNGVTPAGAVCTTPGLYTPSGPRGFVRDQENQLFYNQTDLRANFSTGGLEHTFVIGAAFSKEDYVLDTGNLLRTATGVIVAQPNISIADPDTIYRGPVNYIRSGRSQGTTENKAVYAFDTIKLIEQLELNGGVRYENNRAEFRADTYSTVVGATLGAYTRGGDQVSEQDLFSYRVGLNFKPIETVSLYAAYANSRTPRSATVRLGCGTLITAPGGTQDPCDVGAEKARNYEVGAKADLFDRRLQLTAAVFRNERTNFAVNTNDPVVSTLPVLDGRSRVHGVALGASGNITEAWAIFANYTYLKGKVLQAVSNFCLANPGPRPAPTPTDPNATVNPCGNSVVNPDPQRDNILVQTPKHSGSLFTTYTLPFGLQLGYGLTYQGSFALSSSTLAAAGQVRSDDYMTHRAFLSYPITDGLTAQVNVQNFTNERYFTGIRNNGWATPGEDRQAIFSLYYSF